MARKCTGALHREHMMNVIRRAHGRSNQGMRVNARYCYSVKHPIIKQLLKRKLIKVQRFNSSSKTSYTYVIPVDGKTLPAWHPLDCPECKASIQDNNSHAWNCSLRTAWPATYRSVGWQPKNRQYVGGHHG